MLKIMTDWFTAQFKLGTPSKVRHRMTGASELTSCQNVNTMAAFLTLASLYEITGERSYLPYLDSWGEWAMNDLPRYVCRSYRFWLITPSETKKEALRTRHLCLITSVSSGTTR